jgi:hypothetical protein
MVEDWKLKVHRGIERVTSRYDNVGRKTGIPVLGIVISPDLEDAALKEWKVQARTFSDFEFIEINVLELTTKEVEKLGVDNIVYSLENPLPGSDPESELGDMWVKSIVDKIFKIIDKSLESDKKIIYLSRLGALYPASSPYEIVKQLVEVRKDLTFPVILFIPGKQTELKVYKYLNLKSEFMYRGELV